MVASTAVLGVCCCCLAMEGLPVLPQAALLLSAGFLLCTLCTMQNAHPGAAFAHVIMLPKHLTHSD